jgi:pimeloyl-ACP methyl ester carboxylesterase/CRP-like cAMP-binding protein
MYGRLRRPHTRASRIIEKILEEGSVALYDDLQIHAVEEGHPNRQVALLVHGWSSSWYAMSPLLKLLGQRFRAISVDLPGYGASPPLPERVTIPAYADVLASFIERVTDGPVVLVGHSMGGMIGVTLALQYPALIERLVLIGPTISGRLSTSINLFVSPITMLERFGLGSLMVSSVERMMVGLTDRLMRPVSYAERSGITRDEHTRLQADVRRPGQGKVRAECFFAMREHDLSGRLGHIETPALVLWGAEDNTVPLRDAGVVADEWPTADLRIIPKAGHWPHFETPDTVRRQVAAFLGLPLFSDSLHAAVGDDEIMLAREVAQFLAHSDIANDLNMAQRMRLAAQFRQRIYPSGSDIASTDEAGNELFIVQSGTVEVWVDRDQAGEEGMSSRRVASYRPGQMLGEFAFLDQGRRSADLTAGPEGATVLALTRDRLLALCEDDAVLATRLLWNLSVSMVQRVRFIQWQLRRAEMRATISQRMQSEEIVNPYAE